LLAYSLGPNPSLEQIQAIVQNGFPKPADDKARATKAHTALMKWGHDVLVQAFRLKILGGEQQLLTARDLRERLLRFVEFGDQFGDRLDNVNYGNLSLELVWFMGNMARAGTILRDLGPRLANENPWSPEDQQRFSQWASRMAAKYFELGVFPAGLSNRKASQIETLLRIDLLASYRKRAPERLLALNQLLLSAIDTRGIIPEDSPRDKYHSQFFLASALQTLRCAKAYQVKNPPISPEATQRLLAAIQYVAVSNTVPGEPKEFPAVQGMTANFEIPFWYLVPPFYAEHGKKPSPAVETMVRENYKTASRFDLAMNWGFNAFASYHGI
jgi:hypothetical protein